jgi:hypothetical protein
MKKTIILTALASSLLTFTITLLIPREVAAALPTKIALENARVKVSEITYLPGAPRERYTRPTDQIIVFLDECKYERTDSTTGEKTVRARKAGEVIWHDKGEDAPVLRNLGARPYRTLVVELK